MNKDIHIIGAFLCSTYTMARDDEDYKTMDAVVTLMETIGRKNGNDIKTLFFDVIDDFDKEQKDKK